MKDIAEKSLFDFQELLKKHQIKLKSIGKIIKSNSKKEVVHIE